MDWLPLDLASLRRAPEMAFCHCRSGLTPAQHAAAIVLASGTRDRLSRILFGGPSGG